MRKSVANHLNDIAKDHPDYVIKVLKAWQKEAKTPDERKRLLWIIKHSLRSLIKAGHKEALKLIGVDSEFQLVVKAFRFREDTYSIGEELNFSLELHSKSQMDQNIVLDYVIHYRKANGQLNAKVFKWKTFTLAGKEKLVVSKKHSLKAVTTRVHYAGEHGLSIQVNGQIVETAKWSLLL